MPTLATGSILGRKTLLSLGPANVILDPEGEAIDLGGLEKFVLRLTTEKAPAVYMQNGTQPADEILTGQNCEVEFGLAEGTLELWEELVQGFRLNTDSSGNVLGFSWGSAIGQRDQSIAKRLRLIELDEGANSADPFGFIDIWRFAPSSNTELTWDAASQRFVGITGRSYLDFTQLDVEGKPTFFGAGIINDSGSN